MTYRVQYLKDQNGHYVGCIAIKENLAHKGAKTMVVEYRVSTVNPSDSFDKDVARQLAIGRLVEAPYTVRVKAGANLYEISNVIMADITADSTAPSRTRRAAKNWLRSNSK
jgi:purine nucleoside permease